MKLRTSLAAAATATAVMVSGGAVADAAPTVNDTAESKSKDSDKKTIKDSLSSVSYTHLTLATNREV